MNHYQHNNSNNSGGGGGGGSNRPTSSSSAAVGLTTGSSSGGGGGVGPGVAVLRSRGPPNVKVKRKCIEIVCEPCVIFLVTTILVTALASALLSIALTSRYWEMMIYDQDKLKRLFIENSTELSVNWFFDGRVPRIAGTTGGSPKQAPTPTTSHRTNSQVAELATANARHNEPSENWKNNPRNDDNYAFSTNPDEADTSGSYVYTSNDNLVFLLPLHSGVWISCIDLTEQEFTQLKSVGYDNDVHCVDHLNPDLPRRSNDPRASWQHRMQNLAIACAMVCLILLGAAIFVGLFGILRRQISAVLVTGVIYVLAALFSLFTLTIVHLKHKNRQERDPLDVWTRLTPDYTDFRSARIISHGWSLQLAWAGTFVCILASIMWILLSKIMRYNPISLLP